jgi:hypothetical protein
MLKVKYSFPLRFLPTTIVQPAGEVSFRRFEAGVPTAAFLARFMVPAVETVDESSVGALKPVLLED